jgi:hypothetical protein
MGVNFINTEHFNPEQKASELAKILSLPVYLLGEKQDMETLTELCITYFSE